MGKRRLARLAVSLLAVALGLLSLPLLVNRVRLYQRNSCQTNLKQVGQAFALYRQDYDGRFPLSKPNVPSSVRYGWADGIYPYAPPYTGVLHCPAVPKMRDSMLQPNSLQPNPRLQPSETGYTDYWYNAHLSSVHNTAVRYPQATLLLGEGNDGFDRTDAAYSKSKLPASWLTDSSKPPWRHLGGANYLYVDGHVSWLYPNQIKSNLAARGKPTTPAHSNSDR
jgi:prepilin-type processing-associated H-X9-DG protein